MTRATKPKGPSPMKTPTPEGAIERLTKAEIEFLRLATRTPNGNPWRAVSMSQRSGGAKMRLFDRMKARGLFDAHNRITDAGRAALTTPTEGK